MKKKTAAETTLEVPVNSIVRNPEQPRKIFDPTEMDELAASIKQHGVIQPIAVEEADGAYILHDGERRWRAAKLAGLATIPARVSPGLNGTGPRERLERALIANVQRADMHPVEEALAYRRMTEQFGYTINEVAKRVSKHYTRVHSMIQLSKLEPEILQLMLEKQIASTQDVVVQALFSVPAGAERIELAKRLAERRATARMIMLACRRYNELRSKPPEKRGSPAVKQVRSKPANWDALQQSGQTPPWILFREHVLATCNRCPLQDIANERTCRDCGLVTLVKTIVEAAHG